LEVKVLYTPGKGRCKPDGNGVPREVESEGSRRQNAGLTNRKRIEAAQRGKQANRCEARFLHGTLRPDSGRTIAKGRQLTDVIAQVDELRRAVRKLAAGQLEGSDNSVPANFVLPQVR
jgi:hypothetical protein